MEGVQHGRGQLGNPPAPRAVAEPTDRETKAADGIEQTDEPDRWPHVCRGRFGMSEGQSETGVVLPQQVPRSAWMPKAVLLNDIGEVHRERRAPAEADDVDLGVAGE